MERVTSTISLSMYIFDVVSDILLALSFYQNNDVWYFSLTLTFVLLSTVLANTLSCVVLCKQLEYGAAPLEHKIGFCVQMFDAVRILLHCCLLGMVYRYAVSICGGHDDYYKLPTSTVKFLGLLEIFLESAPQLILQLYILNVNTQIIRPEFLANDHVGVIKRNATALVTDADFFQHLTSSTMIFQAVSIVASILSISWVLTKLSEESNWKSMIVNFICHIFTIAPHIFALSLFASIFSFWFIIVVLCRCVIVGCYFCRIHGAGFFDFWEKLTFAVLISFWNLAFFNMFWLIDAKKLEYYIYFLLEVTVNSILVALWSWGVDSTANDFVYVGLTIYCGCVGVSFLFMVIYLRFFYSP